MEIPLGSSSCAGYRRPANANEVVLLFSLGPWSPTLNWTFAIDLPAFIAGPPVFRMIPLTSLRTRYLARR